MDVSIYLKKEYIEIYALKMTKNKANIMVHGFWFIVHGKNKER